MDEEVGKTQVGAVVIVLILLAAAVAGYFLSKSKFFTKKVACTMEAKICPDGTAVGRAPPNCEFAPCPIVSSTPIISITQEELSQGWYWGSADGKKPGTPEDWVFTGEGSGGARWQKPDGQFGCGSSRPKVCTLECLGSPPYLCGSDGKAYCSVCAACSNKNVDWYVFSNTPCQP